ncbi:hypothetical protein UF16_19270 [Chromobacterium violaceum]|nr:hypothetical protein UF16_19270 [Chromobacterium violaceum]
MRWMRLPAKSISIAHWIKTRIRLLTKLFDGRACLSQKMMVLEMTGLLGLGIIYLGERMML